MKKTITLRAGGVPEHFNLPWHLAIDSGSLAEQGMDVIWQDYPGGTGSMVAALNAGEVDVAMLLTEGAVNGLAQGGDYEIVCFYTQTPLVWGVHVPAQSQLKALADLDNSSFAISRYGSGSHLMAYLLADQLGWNTGKLSFEVIGNLEGARTLFKKGGKHVFLWEKFMTQPLVDNGEFRRLADLPTPWPCFVVCVRKSVLSNYQDYINAMIKIVLTTAAELKTSPIAAKLIASRYGLKVKAVEDWLAITSWSLNNDLDSGVIQTVSATLQKYNLI